MKHVVLLSGWGMGPAVFGALGAQLEASYTVGRLDLPGYGDAPDCEPYTLERVAGAIAERAPAACSVLGWSLGAQVALAWAHACPQQVERLALIGATPAFVAREGWAPGVERAVFEAFAAALEGDCSATLAKFVLLQAQGDAAAKRVGAALRKALAARPLPSHDVLERGLNLLRENDLRERLPVTRQPVLLVHGEHDRLAPLLAARSLAKALPDARLEVIEGASHAPFVSAPQRVGRLVERFFA